MTQTQRRYYPVGYPQQPDRPQSNLSWVMIGIVCFLLFQFANNGWPFNQPDSNRQPDNQEQIVEPDDPAPKPEPSDKLEAKDSFIARVYETEADKAPAWLVNQIQNDKFWHSWVKAEKGITLETADKDLAAAKTFVEAAKKRGIDPPFWIHGVTGKGIVLSVTPFSESLTEEDWKKIILKSVK